VSERSLTIYRLLAAFTFCVGLSGCAAIRTSTDGQGHDLTGSAELRRILTEQGRGEGGASLVVEPIDGNDFLLHMISGARRQVDLVMYELSDEAIEQALAKDEQRGVRVRVLLNGSYYGAGTSQNAAAYRYLASNGVAVHYSPSYFALTHQKTLVIDHNSAAILTFNFTPRYYTSSRDFGIRDRLPNDINALEAVFGADWNAQKVTLPDSGDDLVWSPGSEQKMLSLIDAARSSLEIYNEEMADPGVLGALCKAAKRGVNVRVVMTYQHKWRHAFSVLAGCAVQIRTYAQDASLYIHAKMILVDKTKVFLGSQNFSVTSLEQNRELGIVVSDRRVVALLRAIFASDWAGGRLVT
jgi:cardiolipin synthase A/B